MSHLPSGVEKMVHSTAHHVVNEVAKNPGSLAAAAGGAVLGGTAALAGTEGVEGTLASTALGTELTVGSVTASAASALSVTTATASAAATTVIAVATPVAAVGAVAYGVYKLCKD